ncbi:MAG: NUDIX domain-containing protein [Bacteriovoracaceae bacterium]|nr:NUDIX domain-containing protein [Bacteriovoracaceae bacterium]
MNPDGQVWFQRRHSSDSLNGKLEFPGGKIEPQESPVQAAVRELKEETGVEALIGELSLLKIYNHSYPDINVNLFTFILREHSNDFNEDGWFELNKNWREELSDQIPAANWPILADLIGL